MMRLILLLAAILTCYSCLAGAWGPGSFDNDDARDWLEICLESEGSALVYSALQAVVRPGVIDATEGARAIAAAEVVAAAKGQPSDVLTKEASAWLSRQPKQDIAKLVSLARRALSRVKDPQYSELQQLWSESKDEQWTNKIAELEARLQ